MWTEQIMCLNRGRSKGEDCGYKDCGHANPFQDMVYSLNLCVAYIFLFWIAIWPLCGKVTVRLAFC